MTNVIVDKDRCTQCGICAKVCGFASILEADKAPLPQVLENIASLCIKCGHCEVSCPEGALKLNFALDEIREEIFEPEESPDHLGNYMKFRRSVRHFTSQKVGRELIEHILDITRYAASGSNSQPVQWIVVYDEKDVQRIVGLTIDWINYLHESKNPMGTYMYPLVAVWERGFDPICWNAPHLLIAHIPENKITAPADGIIALTHFDIAAPAFGIGTCWAGTLTEAAKSWKPLQEALALPPGRVISYAMMFGYPQYKVNRIPRRNPVHITWL